MREGRGHRPRERYALTASEHGHVWGVCAEVEGLFGEPGRGTYELFGWMPDGAGLRGWTGSRAWLVPEDSALGPWLLEDAESLGVHPRTDALVLTGLDDFMGPPEGHRAPVRLHDGYRWLGSCRESGQGFVHASGSSARLSTSSGSLAAATWARVTSPRILRTLARTAIHRGSRDSAGPM